jgi:hypothetical protein
LPAATALRQSFPCVLAEVIASSQTLTSRSSVSVDGGVAPHHQSPTSAMEPAGQDLGARKRSGLTTVPLKSRPNASPLWIILLLSLGALEHGMIDADRAPGGQPRAGYTTNMFEFEFPTRTVRPYGAFALKTLGYSSKSSFRSVVRSYCTSWFLRPRPVSARESVESAESFRITRH